MKEIPKNTNWFVRCLIIVFSILLVWMVYTSFTKSSSPFSLNSGIIIVIGIITIVILSESFNNLSVGQLITLSRKVEMKEEENEKLVKENFNLSSQFVQLAQVVSNIKQTQNNTNNPINFITLPQGQQLSVVQADQAEKNVGMEEITVPEEMTTAKDHAPEENKRLSSYQRIKVSRKIEEISLNKYIEKFNLPILDFQKDVKFSEAFEKIDPIMEKGMIFDGYISLSPKEYFFEVKIDNNLNLFYWDRLYIMLAKILFYRQAKNIQADLTLIKVEIPEEKNERLYVSTERFFQAFQPAIANNLLKIETVVFSKEEYQEVVNKVIAENSQTSS